MKPIDDYHQRFPLSAEQKPRSRWFDLHPPPFDIAFMACAFTLGGCYFLFNGDDWYTRWACPWFIPLGIGLWLKHTWARWTAASFFTLGLVAVTIHSISAGLTSPRVLRAAMAVGFLYSLWAWKLAPPEDEDVA